MLIRKCVLGPFETNSYLAFCSDRKEGLIIDPGFEPAVLLKIAEELGVEIRKIVLTHAHLDHTLGSGGVKEASGAPIFMHSEDVDMLQNQPLDILSLPEFSQHSPLEPDHLLAEGDWIEVGEEGLRVLHTPGHTPGSICLLSESLLFSGDTLFAGGVGRSDLPGGDEHTLMESIKTKLLPLADHLEVKPGHGPDTTIGQERRHNPFLLSP